MTSDPKVRKNGLCAQCEKPRKHARWNKYGGDQAVFDPFCTMECCRAWHGCSLPGSRPRTTRVAMSKSGDLATETRRKYRREHADHERVLQRERDRKRRKRDADAV